MMSEENKLCEQCGKLISTPEDNYYSHIRIKYCDVCRQEVNREKARQRKARQRESDRQFKRRRIRLKESALQKALELSETECELKEERIRLLEEQNELLMKAMQRQREGRARTSSDTFTSQIRKKAMP